MRTLWTIVLLICIATISCQQYGTGVQQSLARADEAVVISFLRTIALAQQAYSVSNAGEYGTLEQLTKGGYLDERFAMAKPIKDYVLELKATPQSGNQPAGYTCTADPDRTGDRAGRHFFITSASGQIHVNATQQASETDEILK